MTTPDDYIRSLGLIALGSRLRRLSDVLMQSSATLYAQADVGFEPRWFPLFRLLDAKGPLTVSDAAAHLRVTHAAVSTQSRQLRERGLVNTGKDPADERRTLLRLTEEGEVMCQHLRPFWGDMISALETLMGEGADLISAMTATESALERRDLVARVRDATAHRAPPEVELFTPERAPDFERLTLAWLNAHFEPEARDLEILGDPQRHIIDPGGEIFFAVHDGVAVGTCAMMPHGPGVYELAKMGVDEAWQGRGIGRSLLEAALAWAETAEAHEVELETSNILKPAIALYRRLGFEEAPLKPSPYARCNVRMVKRMG